MTKSNKILLKTLLKIESNLGKTQQILDNNSLVFSIQFDFNHIYDLFEIIISAFDIPECNFELLYNLLNQLYSNELSVDETLEAIELLIL